MKKQLQLILFLFLGFIGSNAFAQTPVTLSTTATSYTENFNGISTGLPAGFSVNNTASATSVGVPVTFLSDPSSSTVAWNSTTGGAKNFASANNAGFTSATTTADQAAATNRALGVRQTGAYDPGTAFVFAFTNTADKKSFKLNFSFQSLDAVGPDVTHTATWIVDYALPSAPTTFISAGSAGTTGPVFTSTGVSIDFGNKFDGIAGTIIIRVVTLTTTTSTGSGNRPSTAIDDWTLSWAGTAAATPTIAATPTSLDFGATQTVGSTSAAKSTVLSGTNLTGATTVDVTGPYLISKDNSTFGTTELSYSTTEMASTTTPPTVYVKFVPTGTTAASGVGSLAIATAGTTTGATVSLTGTGAAVVPTLTATPTSLAFGNVNEGLTSSKTFTLTGTNLTASTTVTVTAPYLISKSGFADATTQTYTAAELNAGATVTVKFTPTTTATSNQNITFANTDVGTALPTVALSGTGVVPTLTVTPTSLDFGFQTILTSAVKTYTLSGTNLTGTTSLSITGTGSANYLISKTGTTGTFATTLTYSATDLATNQIVYVQFNAPVTTVPSPASIQNSTTGTGATAVNVSLTGTAVAAPVPLLTLSTNSLTFSSFVGSASAAQSYTITGTNINGATSVTVAAPYSISTTANGTYGTTINYTTADFPLGVGVQTVYVKFTPTAVGASIGSAINATANGTNQIVTLNGTGVGVPVLAVTPTSLTFGGTVINTSSAAQTYTLTGTYITANTTVTVAAPFSISKTSTGTYGTSLTYSASDMASAQTVYVQFNPTVIGTTGNTGSALNASTNAASQSVTLSGTGLGVPTLTVNPTSLAFGNQPNNASSTAQTFTLTGANITAATTTVATTAPFAVSKDGVTFSQSITFTPADFVSAKTIYVNFTPAGSLGAATGSVTITGTTQTVALTGTAITPPNVAPTIAAIADVNACYVSTQQSIALTGISAVESSQTITSLTVTSTNPALFSALGVLPLSGTTSTLYYTLSGKSGTAVVSVTVKDNGGTTNGGVDTYVRTFNITVNAAPVVTITTDVSNNLLERGTTATLTATGGVTYAWTSSLISTTTGYSPFTSPVNQAVVTIRPNAVGTYTVVATNASGCTSTQIITINLRNSLKLETSNILTPNGDGINDYWVIRNIDLYPANTVKVFDKTGKLIFVKTGYANDWNGYYNGVPLPQGTYLYVVDLGISGKAYEGYISVIRD